MPESTVRSSALERFLRYVTYDTRSDPHSTAVPTTPGQLVLLDRLVVELRELGLADAERSAHGVVMATLPATAGRRGAPTIGFIAHVDTSPELSGAGVRPIVHRAWDGRDIVLPDAPGAVLRADDDATLRDHVGHDIVTASGATLLGADDKSGVAVILAALERLVRRPEIAHGPVRVAFTPDEEVGRGVDHFDVARFGARCAYTLDGAGVGEIDTRTFSADEMVVVFQGRNTHPGLARGRMINAIKVAADFVRRLPRAGLAPETTAGDEGFVHPVELEGGVDRALARFILRDFDSAALAGQAALLEALAREAAAAWPGAEVECRVTETYRNLEKVLRRDPEVVEHAREAMRRAGIEARETAVRGGTDGSRLSLMGLPTPNLFTGQHNYHSRLEWISAQDMDLAVDVVVELCRVWAERG